VKPLFFKKGDRRSGGERHPFAFFVAGAFVVLAVVFVIGMQVGRIIEKGAAQPEGRERGALSPGGSSLKDVAFRDDIHQDMSAFAEDAARVPAVAPQTAREALAETEKALTFRETLEGVATGPISIASPALEKRRTAKAVSQIPPGKTFEVQAGAFRERKAAETLRARLAADGIRATVREASGQDGKRLYRVVAGPFPDRDQANRTIRRLKERMKIDAILVAG
jgi:cell division septation protein DedD